MTLIRSTVRTTANKRTTKGCDMESLRSSCQKKPLPWVQHVLVVPNLWDVFINMRVYPNACRENCKWYSSLPLDAAVSLFCEPYRHNPLCCFSTNINFCYLFRYRLSLEAFGYTLLVALQSQYATNLNTDLRGKVVTFEDPWVSAQSVRI
jgi:hypothetical protein